MATKRKTEDAPKKNKSKKSKVQFVWNKYNLPLPIPRKNVIKEVILKLNDVAFRDDVLDFSLKPFIRKCKCIGLKDKDLSDRCFQTIESILDFADCDFIELVYKYEPSFTFKTPELNEWKFKNKYALTIEFKNSPDPKLTTFFPVLFGTRLHAYCVRFPNEFLHVDKLIDIESNLYCMLCSLDQHILHKTPNAFKMSGRILYTCNFLTIKEKRRPFLTKGKLIWFVNKQKIVSDDEEIEEMYKPGFENLLHFKDHFKISGFIGHCSVMPTGGVFVKALHSLLCVVYNIKPTVFKYKTNLNRYEKNIIMGNVDSILGTIKFHSVNDNMGITDQPIGTANKMAANTKSKSEGYHKPKTSYLQVGMDYRKPIFSGMKMIPQMSKERSIREIHEDELGLLAIPDTTDGKNCGLNFQLVPGVKIANRLTTRFNIGSVFQDEHTKTLKDWVRKPEDSRYETFYFTDSNNVLISIDGANKQTLICTILSLIEKGIHFDFFIDGCRGFLFSFYGILIYPKYNMTPETMRWLKENRIVDPIDLPILSQTVSTIPYFNHDNNPKIVAASKSRLQDVDCFPFPEIARDYSHPHNIFTVYTQQSLSDSNDIGSVQNVVVAVCCYHGFNVEESIVIHRGAVERGLFMSRELKRLPFVFKKIIDVPLRIHNLTKGKKLKNGTLVFEIMGVSSCNSYTTEVEMKKNSYGFEFTYKDCLYVDKCDYLGRKEWNIVDYSLYNDGDNATVVIEVETVNCCLEGDKLTTSHGQKGIVSKIVNTLDMPFFADGTIPDVIINVSSNDRMTIGQNLEGYACFFKARTGQSVKTLLSEMDWISQPVKPITQSIYDGITGEYLSETTMMIIPYRRLKQDAEQTLQNTVYKHKSQKMDVITGQLQKGKSNRGGVSLGTMENANVFSTGSKQFGKQLTQMASGSFDNAKNIHVGVVNRTASSVNDVMSVNGRIFKLLYEE